MAELQAVTEITRAIIVVRGQRVLLDADLARMFGVTTARLNQQVRRNRARFPADFMFSLSAEEHSALMLQIATSNKGRGGRRSPPLAFTEHGAIMAATVLNSPRAIEMSIFVVRAFVRLRELLRTNRQLAKRLDALEAQIARKLGSHDRTIASILDTLRRLTREDADRHRPIGFTADLDETR